MSDSTMFKIITAVSLSVLLLFSGTFSFAAAVTSKSAPPSFASLGLYGSSHESAEKTLMRAHMGDTQAMALVVVGYHLGIEGFPQNKKLAFLWSYTAGDWGALHMRDLLSIYAGGMLPDVDNLDSRLREAGVIGSSLALMESANKSHLAESFKKVIKVDIRKEITALAGSKEQWLPAWKEDYREAAETNDELKKGQIELVKKLRNIANRKAMEEELQWLQGVIDRDTKRQAMLYLATTHEPESEAPDWRAEKLLEFTSKFKKEVHLRDVLVDASIELKIRLFQDKEQELEIIRRAHAGDIPAMRSMALWYATNSMGPTSLNLSMEWLESAGRKGDAVSMLVLANDLVTLASDPQNAWAWAKLAQQYGDPQIASLAQTIQNQIESEASPEDMSKAQTMYEQLKTEIHPAGTKLKQ